MGFWNRGSSSDSSASESSSTTSGRDFSSEDESSFDSTNFASSAPTSASLGGGGAGDLQQFSLALQQQILVQQVVTNLTDLGFEKCVSKPSDSLSGREAACIHATVGKWMDTNEYMMGRMQKKTQQQASPSFS